MSSEEKWDWPGMWNVWETEGMQTGFLVGRPEGRGPRGGIMLNIYMVLQEVEW
jgi:hypothetical protein